MNSYVPIQIPNILSESFNEHFHYREVVIPSLRDFVICMWRIEGKNPHEVYEMNNVILPDGCIDLVISYTGRVIGFSGMSKTVFDFKDDSSQVHFGFRMVPGAFHELFDHDARVAMDSFLDASSYFIDDAMQWEASITVFIDTITKKLETYAQQKRVSPCMTLFAQMWQDDTLHSTEKVAHELGYSVRQTQRIFMQNFGLGVKQVLSVIRLQKSLRYLTQGNEVSLRALAQSSGYYDQAHFNRDIKENVGVTPMEVLEFYR